MMFNGGSWRRRTVAIVGRPRAMGTSHHGGGAQGEMTYVLISPHFEYHPWASLSVKPDGACGESEVFDDVASWRRASRNMRQR